MAENTDSEIKTSYRRQQDTLDKTRSDQNRKEKKGRFSPPSCQQVREYLKERNITTFNAESFIDFYESKNWMIGKNKMKNWKAAVRTWEQRDRGPDNKSVREILRGTV